MQGNLLLATVPLAHLYFIDFIDKCSHFFAWLLNQLFTRRYSIAKQNSISFKPSKHKDRTVNFIQFPQKIVTPHVTIMA